ncbi:MAG: hypothetical protein Q4D77_05075 [Peptostreptococcaceae bacterium]|nr:hypothetical protein [Peptostreptococcaceae bacterium]
MKNQKMIIVLAVVLIIVAGAIGIYKSYRTADGNVKDPIIIDNMENGKKDDGTGKENDIEISKEDALQLATEQIDIDAFTISISDEVLEQDGESYYLFDVVNKSGPSFGMQMAVNRRSGNIMAYDPTNKELLSMTQFPIETPIAQVQEWSGIFLPTENSEATKGLSIELLQADQNSFEFSVLYENGEQKSFYAIAKIDGSKALYASESDYQIIFVKDGEKLSIKEVGNGPLMADEIFLQGDYELIK